MHLDHQVLGADAVSVEVISPWQRVYLPLVMRGGAREGEGRF